MKYVAIAAVCVILATLLWIDVMAHRDGDESYDAFSSLHDWMDDE